MGTWNYVLLVAFLLVISGGTITLGVAGALTPDPMGILYVGLALFFGLLLACMVIVNRHSPYGVLP